MAEKIDPFKNIRAVRERYKCSKCNVNVVCKDCADEPIKAQYFAALEMATYEDMKNNDTAK